MDFNFKLVTDNAEDGTPLITFALLQHRLRQSRQGVTAPATPEELRRRYELGATVEQLSLDHHIGPQKVRDLLKEAGTTMRSVGGRKGVKHGNVAKPDGKPVDSSTIQNRGTVVRPSVRRNIDKF